jgi:hypothetical protein
MRVSLGLCVLWPADGGTHQLVSPAYLRFHCPRALSSILLPLVGYRSRRPCTADILYAFSVDMYGMWVQNSEEMKARMGYWNTSWY